VHLLAFHNTDKDVPHQQQPFLDERQSFAVEDIRVDTQLLDQVTIASQFLDKRANRTGELSTRARIASSLVQIYTLGLRSFFVLEKPSQELTGEPKIPRSRYVPVTRNFAVFCVLGVSKNQ